MSNAPLLCIAGPTASGKSSLALELVELIAARSGARCEIVSVDSAQVYRGMDIGTAAPTAAERARCPHHLVDIVDPSVPYSAARFIADANAAMLAIRARGAVPILVGGTMMYFHALAEGLSDLPAANPAIRARIDALAATAGWPAVHAALARVDPVTAARLRPTDSQRLQRALEVHEASGVPLSDWLEKPRTRGVRLCLIAPGTPAAPAVATAARRWREELHARIHRRFLGMLESGLVDEVMALRARGDLDTSLPSVRSVGYRQLWSWLDGEYDRGTMVERAVIATRQLAKRQITWLRSMPDVHWLGCERNDWIARAVNVIDVAGVLDSR